MQRVIDKRARERDNKKTKKHFTTIKKMHIDRNKKYATFKIKRKKVEI